MPPQLVPGVSGSIAMTTFDVLVWQPSGFLVNIQGDVIFKWCSWPPFFILWNTAKAFINISNIRLTVTRERENILLQHERHTTLLLDSV